MIGNLLLTIFNLCLILILKIIESQSLVVINKLNDRDIRRRNIFQCLIIHLQSFHCLTIII